MSSTLMLDRPAVSTSIEGTNSDAPFCTRWTILLGGELQARFTMLSRLSADFVFDPSHKVCYVRFIEA